MQAEPETQRGRERGSAGGGGRGTRRRRVGGNGGQTGEGMAQAHWKHPAMHIGSQNSRGQTAARPPHTILECPLPKRGIHRLAERACLALWVWRAWLWGLFG